MIIASVLSMCLLLSSIHPTIDSNPRAVNLTQDTILGRWDMIVESANGTRYPSWFEATDSNGTLRGRFVGRVGSQRPIKDIQFANGHLEFSLPVQYEQQKADLKFEANLVKGHLEGTTFDAKGGTLKWTATRASELA